MGFSRRWLATIFSPLLASILILNRAVPELVGYALTATSLTLVILVGMHRLDKLHLNQRLIGWVGVYIFGLCLLTILRPTHRLPLYVVATALSFTALFLFAPPPILQNRNTYSWWFCLLGGVLTTIGISELLVEHLVVGISFPITGNEVLGVEGLRIRSVFWNSNVFGFFMMVAVLIGVYRYDEGYDLPKWLFGLLLLGFILAGSESTYLGLSVALFLLLTSRKPRWIPGTIVGGLFVFGLLWLSGYPQQFIRTGLNGRLFLWRAGILRLFVDPVFGVRWQDVSALISVYLPPGIGREGAGPHNSYIWGLLNLGIFVGSAYLLVFLTTVREAIQQRMTPWNFHCAGVLVAMAVDLMFRSQTIGGLSTTSLLIALYVGVSSQNATNNALGGNVRTSVTPASRDSHHS